MLRSGYARALFDQGPLNAGGSQPLDDYAMLSVAGMQSPCGRVPVASFTAPSPQQAKILLNLSAHWDMTGNDIEVLEWKKASRAQNLPHNPPTPATNAARPKTRKGPGQHSAKQRRC